MYGEIQLEWVGAPPPRFAVAELADAAALPSLSGSSEEMKNLSLTSEQRRRLLARFAPPAAAEDSEVPVGARALLAADSLEPLERMRPAMAADPEWVASMKNRIEALCAVLDGNVPGRPGMCSAPPR